MASVESVCVLHEDGKIVPGFRGVGSVLLPEGYGTALDFDCVLGPEAGDLLYGELVLSVAQRTLAGISVREDHIPVNADRVETHYHVLPSGEYVRRLVIEPTDREARWIRWTWDEVRADGWENDWRGKFTDGVQAALARWKGMGP